MPFGPYKDFDDCVRKNQDKRNPEAYCGSIQDQVENALVAAAVDGTIVRAMAVGWDGRLTDDTDWSIDRSDLPLLTVQIGTLVVAHVQDLDYDQYVVNGIPVDPDTIQEITPTGLVASVCDNCGLPRLLNFKGYTDVPRDSHGRWTKPGSADPGAAIAAKVSDAEADGSTVSAVEPDEVQALLGQLDDLTELMDDPEFTVSKGVKFTRFALDDASGEHDTKFVSQVEGLGIGGALGGFTMSNREELAGNPTSFYVDYVGTTGIADGVGSQLYREAVLHAAGSNLGILGSPVPSAVPFWTRMGWVQDPNDVGVEIWGMSPSGVRALAEELA